MLDNILNTNLIGMFQPSVLEQFEILPIYTSVYYCLDFSITNQTIMLAIMLITLFFIYESVFFEDSLPFVPSYVQIFLESLFRIVSSVLFSTMGKGGQLFFPLLFTVFIFILFSNLIGLIPYSFTITSHFIVTFGFSLFLFLGIILFTVARHKFSFFELFIPHGIPLALAMILTPIEFISYVFKPVSLAIRLFANMMAGHILLKVVAGFAFSLMQYSGVLFTLHIIPILLLIPLFFLEFAVAFIQALVFTMLISIYLNEAINLH